jgi:DNA-binding MarR family transcriptional regulator
MPRPKAINNTAIMIDFVSRLINNYHNTLLEQYKITTKQAKVLSYLKRNEGEEILQKDIEEVFFLRSSTVTSVMQNLEKAGYIERFTNTTDKRMKKILVTAKGNEVFENCSRVKDQLEQYVLDGWSTEEKEELKKLLEKIATKFI